MRFLLLSVALCAGGLFAEEAAPLAAVEVLAGGAKTAPALTGASSAAEILRVCRAMLPVRPVELTGSLILRNRKGIVSSEHDYRLMMRRGADESLLTVALSPRGETNETANVKIVRRTGQRPTIHLRQTGAAETEVVDSPLERVLGTDVTWLDLTFDFLWWSNPHFETEREGESVHGQKCSVILVEPDVKIDGLSAVRLWVDKKTGCLMQAEQVDAKGQPLRRLWGTRVKKMEGKWMVSVLEVETLGSRHRTKITVDTLKEL